MEKLIWSTGCWGLCEIPFFNVHCTIMMSVIRYLVSHAYVLVCVRGTILGIGASMLDALYFFLSCFLYDECMFNTDFMPLNAIMNANFIIIKYK